jgi:hypothetical protein
VIFLALKLAAIAGKTNKHPFDNFVFSVFVESGCKDSKTNEAAATAAGCRKRSRCDDIVINDIVKWRARPPWSARLLLWKDGKVADQSTWRSPGLRSLKGRIQTPKSARLSLKMIPPTASLRLAWEDAGSDGIQTGYYVGITGYIADSQQHNLDGH